MTTSGAAPAPASHWVMLNAFSPYWCKQSAVWPSAGVDLILAIFTSQTCVCLCTLPSLGLYQQFLLVTACAWLCICVLFLCYSFSMHMHLHPQISPGIDQLRSLGSETKTAQAPAMKFILDADRDIELNLLISETRRVYNADQHFL